LPSSRIDGTESFVNRIMKEKPKTILDVGCGFGRYGFLCREYLDVWDATKPYDEHNIQIDAIEIFRPYIGKIQRGIYDTIYSKDATDIPWNIGEYDLIILSDVLEHMNSKVAMKVLDYALAVGGLVYVKTPNTDRAQEDTYGNAYERHKCWIKLEKLEDRGKAETVGDFFIYWSR